MIKKKDHENLTKQNIERVIKLLEAEKPITKKEACQMLRITYNTSRLARIIQDHKDQESFIALRKSQNKGKLATKDEIKTVCEMYIEGYNLSEIATSLYRSPAFVKSIIERVGVPFKHAQDGYNWKEVMLPEQCVSERFEIGEKVWCVANNTPAIIKKEWANSSGEYGYLVYTIEPPFDLSDTFFPYVKHGGRYRNQLACNLGSLRHLEEYGVRLY
tara:strand:- start:152 stop:799 length:648 start_codon:yes stop_codon:yes gene_type:complete